MEKEKGGGKEIREGKRWRQVPYFSLNPNRGLNPNEFFFNFIRL